MTAPQVTARLISADAEWEEIEVAWNALIERAAMPSPFVTSSWLKAWWREFHSPSRSLFIVALFETDRLVAVAPWCIHQIRVGGVLSARCIESLGFPEAHSDYLDVLCERGMEKAAAEVILEFLFKTHSKSWDRLCLRSIPADSTFFLFFLDEIEQRGKYFHLTPGPFCPIVNLPAAPEQILGQLSPKRRKRLMQEWRLLSREAVVKHETLKGDCLRVGVERFLTLYQKRWPNIEPQFGAFLRQLALADNSPLWLEIDFLQIAGRDVAAIVQLRLASGCYGYLQAVDHEAYAKVSLGGALLRLVMEHAVQDGCTFYDFLAGSEEFKFQWTDQGRRSVALTLYQPRVLSLVSCVFRAIKDCLKLMTR